MRSFKINSRSSSMLASPLLSLAVVLLSLAVSACGGAEAPKSSMSAPTSSSALSGAAPSLGTAANFALLAGTAVTCTNSTVTGNVGVAPGVVITQTSCPVTGTLHAGDSTATQAQSDFSNAYTAFAAVPCDRTLTTLDGQSLSPGVYCFDAAATSAGGVLTLNGPSNGIWIFKVGTLGTGALTGTNFKVVTPSGAAPACGSVYWWVAQAVTMTDSQFVGTVLAGQAITFTRGTFNGDALSKAAVTVTGLAATACGAGGGGAPPPTCTAGDCDHNDDGDHGDGDHGDDDHHHKGDGDHGEGHHQGGHHDRGED